MFRYRLHSRDGDDLGEANFTMMIKPGEKVHGSGGERLRLLAVLALENGGLTVRRDAGGRGCVDRRVG